MSDRNDLADDDAASDRRLVARVAMRRAHGRLTISGVERRCRVRDLTPVGVGLETTEPPLPGQRVWIEIPGMPRTAAVVIWRDQGRCGLRFEAVQGPAVDDGDEQPDRRPRAYRFFLHGPIALENRQGLSRIDVRDAAAGGLALLGTPGRQVGAIGHDGAMRDVLDLASLVAANQGVQLRASL